MIDQAFKRLASECAALLTGLRPDRIEVVWRRPAGSEILGTAGRDCSKFVIEVDPELSGDELIRVLLHEVGHVLMHGEFLGETGRKTLAALGYRPPFGKHERGYKCVEDEASELSGFWIDQARRYTSNHSPYGLLEALRAIYKRSGQGFYY